MVPFLYSEHSACRLKRWEGRGKTAIGAENEDKNKQVRRIIKFCQLKDRRFCQTKKRAIKIGGKRRSGGPQRVYQHNG